MHPPFAQGIQTLNRILLTICILLLPVTASAGPRFGVELGLSSVWLSEALEYETRVPSWRLDFNGAATANYAFNQDWSLTTGLRYSRLGNEFELADAVPPDDPSAEGRPATVKNFHQYLGVPFVFQWEVPGDVVYLMGGTELAYLIHAASELKWDEGSGTLESIEYTDQMNRFNMTLIMGIGRAIDAGSHSVEFGFRFTWGLFKTNDNSLSLGWKTRELAGTVGFRF